jgi:hypothetical protein
LKIYIKRGHYYSPEELKYRLNEFVDFYNNKQYHESLQNVTQADMYFGRDKQILKNRNLMKEKQIKSKSQFSNNQTV